MDEVVSYQFSQLSNPHPRGGELSCRQFRCFISRHQPPNIQPPVFGFFIKSAIMEMLTLEAGIEKWGLGGALDARV